MRCSAAMDSYAWGRAAYEAFNRITAQGETWRGVEPTVHPAWDDLKSGPQNTWTAAAQAAVQEYLRQEKVETEEQRAKGLLKECSNCGLLVDPYRAG